MKKGKAKNNNELLYQNQLLKIVELGAEFQMKLLNEAAILANRGKAKEWKSAETIKQFYLKKVNETEDKDLRSICKLLNYSNNQLKVIEQGLKLKNSLNFDFFIDIILDEDKIN